MSYRAEHASALADVKAAGAAVVFTPPSDDTTAVPVSGYAMALPGEQTRYQRLNLVESNPASLFFVPLAHAVYPSLLRYTVTWAGSVKVVRDSDPFAPTGEWITADVVVT